MAACGKWRAIVTHRLLGKDDLRQEARMQICLNAVCPDDSNALSGLDRVDSAASLDEDEDP